MVNGIWMKFLKNWIFDHISISHELIGAFIIPSSWWCFMTSRIKGITVKINCIDKALKCVNTSFRRLCLLCASIWCICFWSGLCKAEVLFWICIFIYDKWIYDKFVYTIYLLGIKIRKSWQICGFCQLKLVTSWGFSTQPISL